MSQDDQIWLRHLDAIAAENITIKAYADREGLAALRSAQETGPDAQSVGHGSRG